MLGTTKKKAPSPERREHPQIHNGGYDTENQKIERYFD